MILNSFPSLWYLVIPQSDPVPTHAWPFASPAPAFFRSKLLGETHLIYGGPSILTRKLHPTLLQGPWRQVIMSQQKYMLKHMHVGGHKEWSSYGFLALRWFAPLWHPALLPKGGMFLLPGSKWWHGFIASGNVIARQSRANYSSLDKEEKEDMMGK